jgi:esterase/lipase superfamily enzyme
MEIIREELRQRLCREILNHNNKRIMIIAHSMGTIIAYDVLRGLGKLDSPIEINHLVTLGSPLGIPYVKYKITQE